MSDEATPERPPPRRATAPPLARVPGWLQRWGLSAWLIIGVLLVATAVYLGLSQIRTLVAPLVVAAVMGMLFHTLVDRLEARGVRRGLAAALILVGLAVIVIVSLGLAVRGVYDQASVIGVELQRGWQQLLSFLDGLGLDLGSVEETVSNAGSGVSGILTATVSSVGLFLVGLLIGTFLLYYLLKDWELITAWLSGHIGLPEDLAQGIIDDTTTSIRRYFYALTISSIPIAIIIGLVMWALDLPLAFTVVLVTFVTAYIPYIGAILSGAFATLVALGAGGLVDAVVVLVAVLVTQNVLQTVLLTRLSSTQLRIHPIVNFASTIIGATLAGILGATLSAPAVASLMAAQRRITAYRWAAAEEDQSASSPERR